MTTPEPELPGELLPALAGRRILIVGRDETVTSSARSMLAPYGCIVVSAGNGNQACEMVGNQRFGERFDAILAEISLPDMSSYELYLKLKQLLEDVPMALVCGFEYDPAPMLAKARHAGLCATVLKPFRREQLFKTIEQLIGGTQ
jgi:two-component system, sensor histidine kinase SagS